MRKISLILALVMGLTMTFGTIAQAKGSFSAPKPAAPAPKPAAPAPKAPSGAKPAAPAAKPAPPKAKPGSTYKAGQKLTKPSGTSTRTVNGKKYFVPKTLVSKKNPYSHKDVDYMYRGNPYGYNHYSLTNFWLWASIFHSTNGDYSDCDQEDLQRGDPDCQYAYEYGGEPNNSSAGWVLTILLALGLVGGVGFLFLLVTRRV